MLHNDKCKASPKKIIKVFYKKGGGEEKGWAGNRNAALEITVGTVTPAVK